MALRAKFVYRDNDSTAELNSRWELLFSRGIYQGGTLSVVAGVLSVDVGTFRAIAFDGMFVWGDAIQRLNVTAGINNWLVCRAKYNAGQNPTLTYEVLTDAQYTTDPDKNYLIVFAKVSPPGGATQVNTADIHTDVRDEVDVVGRKSYRGLLTSFSLLPSTNNLSGDWYTVTLGNGTDIPNIYMWNGTTWQNMTQGDEIGLLLSNHRANANSNEIHMTDAQAAAIAGTSGTAVSGSNKLVDNADPRLPTTGQKAALSGSTGSPGDANRYMTQAQVLALPTTYALAQSGLVNSTTFTLPLSTSFYVGLGGQGTAHRYFNLFNSNVDVHGQFVNSLGQVVNITGVYTDSAKTTIFNPSAPQTGAVNASGFFDGSVLLYFGTDNIIDANTLVSYGSPSTLGGVPVSAFLTRGPQTGGGASAGSGGVSAISTLVSSGDLGALFHFNDRYSLKDVTDGFAPLVNPIVQYSYDTIFDYGAYFGVGFTQLLSTVNDFGTGWTPTTTTVTANYTLDRFDTLVAARLQPTAALSNITKSYTLVAPTTDIRVFSIYVNAGSSSNPALGITYTGGVTPPSAVVRWTTGNMSMTPTVVSGAPFNYGAIYSGEGWWKLWISLAGAADSTGLNLVMYPDYNGPGTTYCIVADEMLEVAAPTIYAGPSPWLTVQQITASASQLVYGGYILPVTGVITIFFKRSKIDNVGVKGTHTLFYTVDDAAQPLGVVIDTSDNLAFYSSSGVLTETSTIKTINDYGWHTLAYDYGQGIIYADGVLVHSNANSVHRPSRANNVYVGSNNTYANRLEGVITELLTEAGKIIPEIQSARNACCIKGIPFSLSATGVDRERSLEVDNLKLGAINKILEQSVSTAAHYLYIPYLHDDDQGVRLKSTLPNTSLYYEALNTVQRGPSADLPSIMFLLTGSDDLEIWSLDNNPPFIWATFFREASTNSLLRNNSPVTNVMAKNGKIYLTTYGTTDTDVDHGLVVIDLTTDSAYKFTGNATSKMRKYLGTLSQRNDSIGFADSNGSAILSSRVNDVDVMTRYNPKNPLEWDEYVILSTALGTTQINPDQTVWNDTTTATNNQIIKSIKNTGFWKSDDSATSAIYRFYALMSSTGALQGNALYNHTSVPAIFTAAKTAGQIGAIVDTDWGLVIGHNTGITLLAEYAPNQAMGQALFLSNTNVSGWQFGESEGAWLTPQQDILDASNRATNLTKTLTGTGVIASASVATGSTVKGYSGFATGVNSAYFQQAYNSWLDYLTNSFHVEFWIKMSSAGATTAQSIFVRKSVTAATPAYTITTNASGQLLFTVTDGTTTSIATTPTSIADNSWKLVVCTFSQYLSAADPGGTRIYVNGVQVANTALGAALLTMNNATATLHIGSDENGTVPLTYGTLALVRTGEGRIIAHPTYVRKMYEWERLWFQPNAKPILGSTNSSVKALAWDDRTKTLVAGTDAVGGGVTYFKFGGIQTQYIDKNNSYLSSDAIRTVAAYDGTSTIGTSAESMAVQTVKSVSDSIINKKPITSDKSQASFCTVRLDGSTNVVTALNIIGTPTYTANSVGFPTDNYTETVVDLDFVPEKFGSTQRGEMIWAIDGTIVPRNQYVEVTSTAGNKVRLKGNFTTTTALLEGYKR